MTATRLRDGLADLAQRFGLPDDAPGSLERLLALVASDPHAPTTVRDPANALSAHVADALVSLDLDVVRPRVLHDLGTFLPETGRPHRLVMHPGCWSTVNA